MPSSQRLRGDEQSAAGGFWRAGIVFNRSAREVPIS